MGSFAGSVPKLWGLYGTTQGFTVLALNRRDFGPTGGGGAVLFEPTTLDIGPGVDLLTAIGISRVPTGSAWTSGLSETRPSRSGVESPSRSATSA